MAKPQRYTLPRHWIFLKFFRLIFAPIFIPYYRFKRKKIRIRKTGPYLIIANHQADFDVIFLDMLFDAPLYYVASEQLLNAGFGSWFLRTFFNPIPKSKSLADFALVKRIKAVVNEGGNIAIFPEGNASMNGGPSRIPDGMGRLIKFLNIPVKIMHVKGIYMSSPRWAYYRKFGPTTIEEAMTIPIEMIAQMSAETLDILVKEKLQVSAYDQPQYPYKGRHLAEGLHKLIFTCPTCQSLFSTYSQGSNLKCRKCDYVATYDAMGYLHTPNSRKSLITLDQENLERFNLAMQKTEKTFVVNVPCRVGFWDRSFLKRSAYQPAMMKLDKNGIKLTLNKGEIFYPYSQLFSQAIQGKKYLLVYPEGAPMMMIRLPQVYSPYAYMNVIQWYKHQLVEGTNHDDSQQHSATAFLGL
jgi:1-acyl-sn-glycerol-3-phosphate acyltransferase